MQLGDDEDARISCFECGHPDGPDDENQASILSVADEILRNHVTFGE